jgi:RHS repeat-associated protein
MTALVPTVTITDESGSVLERLSYDAWGKRRYADGTDDPAGVITSQTSRGFTGHEELDAVGLVHMNGRVYDPLLARFGTPDPTTESPFSTQGWNRYSYVGNSPLNFTDPSGYCFMGCFWQPIFAAIQNLLRSVPLIGAIVQIAAGVVGAARAQALSTRTGLPTASSAVAALDQGRWLTAATRQKPGTPSGCR